MLQVATPKICTITLLQDSSQVLVWNSVSLVSEDCLQSARHRTDEILDSRQRNWFPRFPKMTFEYRQRLWLLAGINSCSDNASKVFSRRQIWWIWRPIFLWSEMSNVVFQLGDWRFWCVCASAVLLKPSITIAVKTALSQSSSSCGLSSGGRCRSYELAPCLSILRLVIGGC